MGLAAGIRWYAEGFEQRTGICVQPGISQDFVRLCPDAELALFRIGFAAIPEISQHRPETKVLVFSVRTSYELVGQVTAASAHGYLCKADAAQELINAVRSVLNGRPVFPAHYIPRSMSTTVHL